MLNSNTILIMKKPRIFREIEEQKRREKEMQQKMAEVDGEGQDITHVFAFGKGSVNEVMAGNSLEPINSFNPTIRNVIVRSIKNCYLELINKKRFKYLTRLE